MRVDLTPEERNAIGIAALTAVVTAVASALGTWVVEEAKAAVQRRRERQRAEGGAL